MNRSTPRLAASSSSFLLLLSFPAIAQSGFVVDQTKIANDEGGLTFPVENEDLLGAAAVGLDLDGDGVLESLCGAPGDDDGGPDRGALYVFTYKPDGSLAGEAKISELEGNFAGRLADGDRFGSAITLLGDQDGDGLLEVAVGAPGDDDGGSDRGALWILELRANGQVEGASRLSGSSAGFPGALLDGDGFGSAVTSLGDQDKDGSIDIAVGAPGRDGAGVDRGAVWTLLLNLDGSIKAGQEIGEGTGGFAGPLGDDDGFGSALLGSGDIDDDSFGDLVVGSPGDDDGGADRGALWILFLDANGVSRAVQKIGSTTGGLFGPLADGDGFGAALGTIGDLDSNFINDLLVGAPGTDAGGVDRGGVWIVLLDFFGKPISELLVTEGQAGFGGVLSDNDRFGSTMTALGDLDADGGVEVVVGASGDNAGGPDRGAVWTLFTSPGSQTNNPGSGVNPQALEPGTDVPRIGRIWDPVIDLIVLPGPLRGDPIFHWVGVSDSAFRFSSRTTIIGELLINISAPAFKGSFFSIPKQRFVIPIPRDPNLVGLALLTQGAQIETTQIILTNGINIVIGF